MGNTLQIDLFTFLSEYAILTYEEEKRRADSIIQQASQMQAAFSFTSAALFVIAQVLVENNHLLSHRFYVCSFSSIAIMLLFSLITATIAQNRVDAEVLSDPDVFHKYMIIEFKMFLGEEQRKKYLAEAIEVVQKKLRKRNDKAVEYIQISMIHFYMAIGLIFIWFIIAIGIVYYGWGGF